VITAAVLFACTAATGAWVVALPVAAAGWFGARRLLRPTAPVVDPLRLATNWDLLAACLRAGLPVSEAVRVIADRVPGDGGVALRTTSSLLALGADAADAWRPAARVSATAELARGACRTARSGTELATVASALAADVRVSANDLAEARAQRAGVLIAGPLGLCFLPAFVCLGVVPVITGLAARIGLGG
jgi:pilus assembly protein TadC